MPALEVAGSLFHSIAVAFRLFVDTYIRTHPSEGIDRLPLATNSRLRTGVSRNFISYCAIILLSSGFARRSDLPAGSHISPLCAAFAPADADDPRKP